MTDGSIASQGPLVQMLGIAPVDGCPVERPAARRIGRIVRAGSGIQADRYPRSGSPHGMPS